MESVGLLFFMLTVLMVSVTLKASVGDISLIVTASVLVERNPANRLFSYTIYVVYIYILVKYARVFGVYFVFWFFLLVYRSSAFLSFLYLCYDCSTRSLFLKCLLLLLSPFSFFFRFRFFLHPFLNFPKMVHIQHFDNP